MRGAWPSSIRIAAWAVATVLALGAAAVRAQDAAQDAERLLRLLQVAGQSGAEAELNDLLSGGAGADLPDAQGRTALHVAAGAGAVENLTVLLAAGASLHRRDADGRTPLHMAADASRPAVSVPDSVAAVRVLLAAGADPNRTDDLGRTPLHAAAGSHDLPGGFAALLGAGADPDRKDGSGDTPLHVALRPGLGWPSAVGALLDGGADPGIENAAGLTPLQLFVRSGADQGRTVSLLIDAGADPNRIDPDGDAPLHAAVRHRDGPQKIAVVEALLAGGADPCIANADGNRPVRMTLHGSPVRRALARAGGEDSACDSRPAGTSSAESDVDRMMKAAKRSNLRSGPGTDHDKVGLLEIGELVRVTGVEGDWFRIEPKDGGTAFVYAPLLAELSEEDVLVPFGPEWSLTEDRRCQVWNYGFRSLEPFRWSGACVHGKASGEGRLSIADGRIQYEGSVRAGRIHGYGTTVHASGERYEGRFRDGQPDGYGVRILANGDRYEGQFRAGKQHGRGTLHRAGGGADTCSWREGEPVGGTCAAVDAEPDPTLPTADERRRVADWIDRCDFLWEREFAWRSDVRDGDLLDDRRARAYLDRLRREGRPVAGAREYVDRCGATLARLRDAGDRRTCDRLGDEIEWRIGERSTALREAGSLLGRRGLERIDDRRALEDYVRMCVPAILAAIEGRGAVPIRDPARATPRSVAGDWLLPGTVEGGLARDAVLSALGSDLVAGEEPAESRLELERVDRAGPVRFGLIRPIPYEFRSEGWDPYVSHWGYWTAPGLSEAVPKYQYSSRAEPVAGPRRERIEVQHAFGLLRGGEFGITRTIGRFRHSAFAGEAAFARHAVPAYDPFAEGLSASSLLHFLSFRAGSEWRGDALAFRVDGESAEPVHGTATLSVTDANPPLPGFRCEVEIVWSDGDRIRFECLSLGLSPFRVDAASPDRVLSVRFLGPRAEEAIGTYNAAGFVGAFGLRQR